VFGPVDAGRLDFVLDGEPCALDIPDDGRLVAGMAAAGRWPSLFPDLVVPEYRQGVNDRLMDPGDTLSLYTSWLLVHALSPQIYGMEWWAATQLCATADQSWRAFGSWSVTVGFDPAAAPAHRICSAALAWIMKSVTDEKDARQLERRIFDPPKPLSKSMARTMQGFSSTDQAQSFDTAMKLLGDGL
jgi:hypothetical protein